MYLQEINAYAAQTRNIAHEGIRSVWSMKRIGALQYDTGLLFLQHSIHFTYLNDMFDAFYLLCRCCCWLSPRAPRRTSSTTLTPTIAESAPSSG